MERRAIIRRAAVRATLAPSVLDTQPWRLHIGDDLHIRAEPADVLEAVDPTGRRLVLSVGCAVMNARVSLSASGLAHTVARFPDPSDPTLCAVLTSADPGASVVVDDRLVGLDLLVAARRAVDPTVPFTRGVAALEAATAAVAAEDGGVEVRARNVAAPDQEPDVALPGEELVLLTPTDDRSSWLRAGEAMQRVLLELTRAGFGASPSSGFECTDDEHPGRLDGYPQVRLRVGAPGRPVRGRHRRLVYALVEKAVDNEVAGIPWHGDRQRGGVTPVP
jgi:nitroreductase